MVKSVCKMTELGPIPEDWEVKRLGEIWTSFKTGPFGSSLHAIDYVENGTPIINPMHILDGRIIPSEEMCIDDATAQRLSEYQVEIDDIIIGRRGEIGRVALVTSHEKGWLCGTGCFFVHFNNSIHAPYAALYLRTPQCVAKLVGEAVGTTLVNLNQSILGKTLIALPPLAEQRRIAGALSDVDELISALGKLIEKKRNIKTGTMQQLLTGKRRLPGFGGKWVEKRLGEIGKFSKGAGISKEQSNSGPLPAVRYGELYTTHHDYIKHFESFISEDVAKCATQLHEGDIVFACSGETKEEIGKCAAYLGKEVAYAGGDLIIFTPKAEYDSLFLGFELNTPFCAQQKAAAGQGDAVVHIRQESIAAITVSVPPTLPEQRAIAAVLSDMDAEIAALEAEQAKYTRIKSGMMQELLTGRTRLEHD